MISSFVLTLVLLVNTGAEEYPGNSSSGYGTTLESSTLSSENTSRSYDCCPCENTVTTPMVISEVIPNITSFQESRIFRLSDSIDPILYRLSLEIDFNAFKTWSRGYVYSNMSIHVTIKKKTDVIYLHAAENFAFSGVTVRNIDRPIDEKNLTKDYSWGNMESSFQINLISNLSVGGNYLVVIDNFQSLHYYNQEAGILIRKYQNAQGEFENMLVTQFQAVSARSVFPCFDEPRFKAKFQLNISTNSEYSILTNMPEMGCQKYVGFNSSSWKTCIFETTPVMSVYNLAFAIVNFSHIEKRDKKGRTYRMWTRHSEINKTQFALDSTIAAFRLFEEHFKIEFPLKKVDSLAIPNLKGFLGMEHYGLITYDEPAIIWSEKFPLSFSKYLCVSIICHEVAHQWFGNLVTLAWWQDLWLNEGFATFYSHKMAKIILKDDLYYPLELMSIFNHVRLLDDYFSFSKSAISAPVSSYVDSKFNYIAYEKGFIIINMLEKLIGPEAFDLSMVDYLNNNKYNSTTPKDLWKSIKKFSNVSIPYIIDGWLSKVCYPIVEVRIHQNSSININQSTSIIYKITRLEIRFKESINETWKIPLYIMFGNNTFRTKEIIGRMDESSEVLKLDNFNISNHWLILNVNYGSFFTTDYEDVMFARLKDQLLRHHSVIPPLNRAQIMQDYYEMSRKFGRNNLVGLLKLFVYIRNETNPIPLITAINLLDKLTGLFQFRSFYPIWNKYASRILQPTFDKFVLDFHRDFRTPNSTYLKLRRTVFNMACKLRSNHCLNITDKIIKRWKTNKLLESDYDLLPVALCKYVEMDTNGENWQSVYSNNKFQSWDYLNVKYYAMGCTKVPWAVEKNIDIAYNVLKDSDDRKDFPHVSQIFIDHVPPDYLHGITSLSNLLVLSSIYNTPNSINFLNRFNKDGLNTIYYFLQYPSDFPVSNSIVEHAVPTLSHYNFIQYFSGLMDVMSNTVLIEAISNIKWILNNRDLEKELENIMM